MHSAGVWSHPKNTRGSARGLKELAIKWLPLENMGWQMSIRANNSWNECEVKLHSVDLNHNSSRHISPNQITTNLALETKISQKSKWSIKSNKTAFNINGLSSLLLSCWVLWMVFSLASRLFTSDWVLYFILLSWHFPTLTTSSNYSFFEGDFTAILRLFGHCKHDDEWKYKGILQNNLFSHSIPCLFSLV